jgi:hypothetical protein
MDPDELPVNHLLLQTQLFLHGEMHKKLLALTHTGERMNPISKMEASGVPPYVELMVKLDSTIEKLAEMPGKIQKDLGQAIENAGVSAGNITQSVLTQHFKNRTDTFAEELKRIEDRIESNAAGRSARRPDHAENQASTFSWFTYGGGLHRVPEDYVLPTTPTLLNAFAIFAMGDMRRKIAPLRLVGRKDLHTKSCKDRFTRWSKIFNLMLSATPGEVPAVVNLDLLRRLYKNGLILLKSSVPQSKKRRLEELTVERIYQIVRKEKKRRLAASVEV